MNSPSTLRYGSQAQQFAALVGGREQLQRIAECFGERRISLMPLKGMLLRERYYEDPLSRPVKDIDLLVPRARYQEAIRCLEELEYIRTDPTSPNHFQCALRRKGSLLAVDLHRSLFEDTRYGLDTAGVFRRAELNESVFGTPVSLMNELDVVGHLVGKLASDHVALAHPSRLEDLRRAGRRLSVSPAVLGRHLDDHGLSRAARYTTGLLQRSGGLPPGLQGLNALSADPWGSALAELAVKTGVLCGGTSVPAKVTALGLTGSTLGSVGLIFAGMRKRFRRSREKIESRTNVIGSSE